MLELTRIDFYLFLFFSLSLPIYIDRYCSPIKQRHIYISVSIRHDIWSHLRNVCTRAKNEIRCKKTKQGRQNGTTKNVKKLLHTKRSSVYHVDCSCVKSCLINRDAVYLRMKRINTDLLLFVVVVVVE